MIKQSIDLIPEHKIKKGDQSIRVIKEIANKFKMMD